MRKGNIDSLLSHASKTLNDIEEEYNKALASKSIPTSLQIDVKNLLENIRSALDYCAHDIYELVISPERVRAGKSTIKRIYFPYGRTEPNFYSSVQSSLPDLKLLNTKIYSILESIQPFTCGDSWICDFCEILNQKKHENLTPQILEVQKLLDIHFSSGARINLGGGTISGSGTISSGQDAIIFNNDIISGNSPAKNTSPGVTQIITKWEYFKFDKTNIIVLPFLKKALQNTEKVIEEIYKELI